MSGETADHIRERFAQAAEAIREAGQRLAPRIARAAEIILEAYRAGGGVLLFGNGGSAADAQHIAGELVGRLLVERRPLRAEALTTDTSVLTALANDYGYEAVFARQIEAKGRPGDVAVALSTSGDSPNVATGLAKAREMSMKTIALTGRGGGRCAEHADVLLDVAAETSPRIQEAHAVIYHTICELVERGLGA
jgi:D-sedoheptulose 7-phosphate isomerase